MSVLRFVLIIDTQANNVSLDHQQILQIEQIRAIEQSGKIYPNGDYSAPNIEEYLDSRAEHLKLNYPLDKTLSAAAKGYNHFLTIIAVIALIAGGSTVIQAVENNTNTLNIFWILIVLLGFNTVSLLIWLVLSVWSHSRAKSPRDSLFHHILTWLVSSSRSDDPTLAASKIWLQWKLDSLSGRWLLSATTHLFWLCYLLGGLALLTVTLSTRQYDFVWGSTILNNDVFSVLTNALSTPMDWLNLPRPSTADLLASQVGTNGSTQAHSSAPSAPETRALWGYFLIGCLAFYGIVPRLTAWLACIAIHKICLKKQTLDLTAPYYLRLQKHWRSLSTYSLIIDEETSHAQRRMLQKHHFASKSLPSQALWVGLELPQTILSWVNRQELLNIIDKATAQQAITALSKTQTPIILLVNGQKSPDRGMIRLLEDLVKTNPRASYWMVCALFKRTSQMPLNSADTNQQHLHAWQGVANLLAIHTEHCAILEIADLKNQDSDYDLREALNSEANNGT